MEFDGRVDRIRDIVKPLKITTRLVRRKDVYHLRFEIKDPSILQPGWPSLMSFVRPLMKSEFPHAVVTSAGQSRINYRLGSLFDFLSQVNN